MTCINIILGTGPIIVPPVFYLAGIGLTTISIVFMICIGFIAMEFLIETISLLNGLKLYKELTDSSAFSLS